MNPSLPKLQFLKPDKERIRELRKRMDLTQEGLHEAIDNLDSKGNPKGTKVSIATIGRVERGDTDFSHRETLLAISMALGVELIEILDRAWLKAAFAAPGVAEGRVDAIDVWLDQIKAVLSEWSLEGGESATDPDLGKMLAHPEYVYRLSGNWPGWSEFLTVSSDSDAEEYEANRIQDALEDKAFDILSILLDAQSNRAMAEIDAGLADRKVILRILMGVDFDAESDDGEPEGKE